MNTETQKPAENVTALPPICEAEDLVHEIRRLLVQHESALADVDVKNRAETLERWLESYRRGLSAAQKISQNSGSFLQEMRERIKLALEEMQRLDDEGGATPASKEQRQRMDDLARIIRRIDHLTVSLGDASFTPPSCNEPEVA